MSEKTVGEILEIHGKNLVEHLNRKKYPDNFYKIDQAETELNALIQSEKIRFAEECVPEKETNGSTNELRYYRSGFNDCRNIILENIRRAEVKK